MPYPPEHHRNFIHLYRDIFWWGVLNGSTIIFLAVYASRLGASTFQIGLLTAAPALTNLFLALPAGGMARTRSVYRITPVAALTSRLFYSLLIPLPLLLGAQAQVWMIVAIVFVMSIPGAVAGVIGNAFLAETVPAEWRGQVVGLRNALLAVASMVTSFAVGYILDVLPFETGYMVVFAIGFLGAMLSVRELFLVKPVPASPAAAADPITAPAVEPNPSPAPGDLPAEVRQAAHGKPGGSLRLDILGTTFGAVLLVIFLYSVAVYLPSPLFSLYQVNDLKFSDQTISLGTGLFWIVHFFGSTYSGRLAQRLGFKRLTGLGTLVTGFSTLFFTYSFQPWIYGITQLLSGIGWSMIGGGLINYVFERVPANDRPAYMAWYSIVTNGALLICGLAGPAVANLIGLYESMLLAVVLRLVAGAIFLKWG